MMIDVVEFEGSALVLQARGRLNILTASGFEADTRQVVADSDDDVIIELSEVIYLSTAGLRAFLLLWKELKEDGRSLHVCGLKPYIQRVFETIGFDQVIPIHPDLASAIAAVESLPQSRS